MELLKKYAAFILLGVACIAALAFYTLNIPKKRSANVIERVLLSLFYPVIKPVASISGTIDGIWNNYINLVDVRHDNVRLREILNQQNSRIIEADEISQENQRLAKLLDMKKKIRRTSLTATIIGNDTAPWFNTLLLDRGTTSSLAEGMPVVASSGVVGQIVKVAPSTSRVLLLTDHTSGIAATILRSRARGVVKGRGEGVCILDFASREDDIKVGDMVVTSGIGGVFPKGLPIGEVTMVKRGEYGIFQTVSIKPSVNISHLEELLVLTGSGND